MTINRRELLIAFALGSVAGGLCAAESYPSKPITIVYPYAGGSASDTLTRQFGEILSKALGQPVVVESRPGAGGSMALEQVTRAPADGHTLVLTASGTMSVNPHIYNLKYKPVEDLAPIAILVDIPFIAVSNLSSPAKNLKEFIAVAKARPGTLSFGNAGTGTQAHLTQVMFLKAAGITANIIPYKGGAPMTTDLLGGHVDAAFDNAAAQVANVHAGRVRPLFVTTQTRSPTLPDVPTADEAGLPGFVASGWFGLAAPKGTPLPIIEKLNRIVVAAMRDSATRRKLLEAGWMPVGSSPEEAAARARADLVRFGAIVSQLGLKPN
ncbi:tripartite-type tricarboxylate transporter receptor subunit TctC [Variovorax boronicumulans]|uniref:Bug family tripartite tricarboxylate transporter substrate binding protein n=1 Tax=Variovorax boronicumulans TaxID=436515 RepID=UPI0027813CCE|nr:tripartite tricarboxylate transporter substrate binding protein [Variovorax boronicumulans]MDP9995159.1 tripartite-type tricarboxylate transporter receptor subunit TctC [Variovorax boronicumulans]MDQ0006449.1 tripartite-type tricarboxylate transporter receptor subunit TctC [Variovorax boronicumulans]